jgi:multiple sugar transport system substrate-binding protein
MRDGRRTTTTLAGVLLAGTAVLNVPAVAQSREIGPLVLVTGADLSYGGIRRQLIDYWNEQDGHEDKQVEVVELSARADLQRAQMLAAAQAGDSSYDLFNLDLTWTAEFAENEAIQPLEEDLLGPDDFYESTIDSARYRRHEADTEQLWAVPFNTDVGLLFYRKDLLDAAGVRPPRSWQDMADALARVREHLIATTGKSSSLDAAYTSQLQQYDGLTVNAVESAGAEGEDLTTLTGVSHGLRALTDNFQAEDMILPESTTFDESGSLQAFRDGRVLFMRNWPFAYNVLAADPLFPPDALGVTRLPTAGDKPSRAALGGQNLAVAKASTKPELAREFVKFLTSPASQQCLFERGGLVAARKGVYDPTAPTHKECFLPPPPAAGGGDDEENMLDEAPDALTALGASLTDAVLRPETPFYSQVTDVIQRDVATMLTMAENNEPQEEIDSIGTKLSAKIQDALEGR